MIRIAILILLILGCNNTIVPQGETKEVAWIYYGNQNQLHMTGCYWTQDYAPIIDWIDEVGIGYGYIEDNLLHCVDYGKKTTYDII